MTTETRKGTVFAIVQNLISVKINAPVMNKEICYVTCSKTGERLMAEAIKVQSGLVNIQVFESTRGVKVGDPVEFTGNMLQVTLGPGLLSKNLDGLQNDLDKIEGTFLKRGSYNVAIELEKEYEAAAKMKKPAIERKITANQKKIDKLYKELNKHTKGTQTRVLKSISSEAKKRSGGN